MGLGRSSAFAHSAAGLRPAAAVRPYPGHLGATLGATSKLHRARMSKYSHIYGLMRFPLPSNFPFMVVRLRLDNPRKSAIFYAELSPAFAWCRIQSHSTGGIIGGYLQTANSIPPCLGVSLGGESPSDWKANGTCRCSYQELKARR